MKKTIAILLIACMLIAPSTGTRTISTDEMKGIWVATVANIDYPSTKTTDASSLKSQADTIINKAKAMGFNTIFLQVRPCADSFYRSNIFPWSKYLTGTQGQAPSGGFDPLEYYITKAHEKGMELHAWINPYRVTNSSNDTLIASHPAAQNAWLTVTHGGKIYWNPGLPQAQKIIADGAKEIVDNYDVDGIHIDDYFYPNEKNENFNDTAAFISYGNGMNLGDWRRSNTYKTVQNLKKIADDAGVLFGVSPFGIWANKSSSSLGSYTNGNQSYYVMFADSRQWVKDGLVDYIAPQIYWPFSLSIARYDVLVDWWCDVVRGTDVDLYIGQGAYRYAQGDWTNLNEITRQIAYHRSKPEVDGFIMYTYNSFNKVPALSSLITSLNATYFPDVIGHWAREEILALQEKGIVNGSSDGYFYPNNNILRANYVQMLLRLLDVDIEYGLPNFNDVSTDKYYADEIATAKDLGLIEGTGDNNFRPEASVSRQDMFTMVYRALHNMGKIQEASSLRALDQFSDKDQINSYAKTAIASLVEAGIVQGNNGMLRPLSTASRAEASRIMYQIY